MVIAPPRVGSLRRRVWSWSEALTGGAYFAWVQDVRANYVCIHYGELAATVFSTAWLPWKAIVHHSQRRDPSEGERFTDLSAAMSRAELLSGSARLSSCHRFGSLRNERTAD